MTQYPRIQQTSSAPFSKKTAKAAIRKRWDRHPSFPVQMRTAPSLSVRYWRSPRWTQQEALAALETTEAELTALGGSYDPDLAAAIGLVRAAFPGARLIRLQ